MHDVFYFTDIHGARPLFDAIMKYCNEQDDEAMIIFGGDAIDRGKDGYAIMKELLENPYVVYLKGNHEDMFCKAAREIKEMFSFENADKEKIHKCLNACKHFDYKYAAIQDSLYNGGLVTLTDWILDGMPMDLVERVERLPLTFVYNDVDFCHAGGTYKTFKEINEKEYYGTKINEWDVDYLLWSRTTIDVGWAPDRTCVFGHTPTPYLEDYLDKFKWPEDCEITPVLYNRNTIPEMTGWKLDMDTGAVFTGRAYVLNILTMKAQGFVDKDFENNEIHQHDVEKIEVIQF